MLVGLVLIDQRWSLAGRTLLEAQLLRLSPWLLPVLVTCTGCAFLAYIPVVHNSFVDDAVDGAHHLGHSLVREVSARSVGIAFAVV